VPNQVARSRIEKRLQKLETVLTDASLAVPRSRKWLLHWTEIMGKYMTGELTRDTLPGLIPLEAFRAVWKACEAGEVDSPYARIVCGEGRDDQEADASTTRTTITK
jgi:hypothetical protein